MNGVHRAEKALLDIGLHECPGELYSLDYYAELINAIIIEQDLLNG